MALRDDAIRFGLIAPTKEDVKRMNLTKAEINKLKKLRKIPVNKKK